MTQIRPLTNTIQNYAWGSRTYISELMNRETPSAEPEAEVWMGAHPKAPSTAGNTPLPALIEADPVGILGEGTATRYGGRLPFLFKLLAAGTPLSIQAHPNLEQAKDGFARDNAAGIPLDAPNRNYRDDNHKPEVLCALSDFWVLNGFREISEMISLLEEIDLPSSHEIVARFRAHPETAGLRSFFQSLMQLGPDAKAQLVDELLEVSQSRKGQRPEYDWVCRIHELYPGDIGVICVILLNLLKLSPGDAMFCAAGDLHAYLDGFGVELMANSDNVLRGGLTGKHVDIPELMSTLTFRDAKPEVLSPINGTYNTPAGEFALSVIEVDSTVAFTSETKRSIEILLNTKGDASVIDEQTGEAVPLERGASVVVPANVDRYTIQGKATIYRATVG